MKHPITTALAGILLTASALPAPAADSSVTMPALPVRVLAGADPSAIEGLTNVHVVKGQERAFLQLDFPHKRVLDSMGLPVADISERNPLALQGTVDKWRYIRALQRLSAARPQEIHIDPDSLPAVQMAPQLPRIYNHGTVNYVVTQVPGQRQVVVFDIDPIGELVIQRVRENPTDPRDSIVIPAVISPPFGVEHIVAISAADPEHMHAFIRWLSETDRARGIIDTHGDILQEISHLKDLRVGILTEYSCESASECGR